MKINVKPWDEYFDIKVSVNGCTLSEDNLTQEEVSGIAIDFIENTVLLGCWRSEVIQKLIDQKLFDVEMMKDYIEDLEN